ncbi:MAG: hypothetical protein KZQ64_09130 [gamma proteobacterium symbiont of Bathyaustriella thionipta]|nr:hypothetical protein [gamma proteobacterium symbiont of Bathyaustriella thionipta]MCU7950589.1 hypothetical protein [gamma proteobacterium symbiont of Bathyaustriella thionipta]MCU7953536.1 hypothetical protein [gamma proteobacterium symbiont of Bathyaustriella thionipta]MCU7957097.1 hypothetical protein [gamma proteobacterium symbiont of Bathyaustriella thionipta]MCU7967688.1 hypothetical protein [gamma proteobacterium symbiont of Bathyaustriella thionipta]
MEVIFRLFWNICRLKQGPETVPSSISLFLTLFICNFILETLLGLTVYSIGQSIFLAFFAILSLFVFILIWLVLFRLTNRYLQTLTTLVGVSLFTNFICFLPISILWKMGVFADSTYAMINLLLIFWILSIYAHVFRSALNISFFLGFALAITYFITFNTIAINLSGA